MLLSHTNTYFQIFSHKIFTIVHIINKSVLIKILGVFELIYETMRQSKEKRIFK